MWCPTSSTSNHSGTTWWNLIEFTWPIGASFDLKIKVNNFWIHTLIIVSMMGFLQRDMFFWSVILILVVVSAPRTALSFGVFFFFVLFSWQLFIQALHPQLVSFAGTELQWIGVKMHLTVCGERRTDYFPLLELTAFLTASSKNHAAWNQPPGNILFCAWWRLNGGGA